MYPLNDRYLIKVSWLDEAYFVAKRYFWNEKNNHTRRRQIGEPYLIMKVVTANPCALLNV